jgi:hypothetical protein
MKFERDKSEIKKLIEVAIEASSDKQTPFIDRVTRIRAAIFWATEVKIDTIELQELETKLYVS